MITIEPGDIILIGSTAESAKAPSEKWLKVNDQISTHSGELGTWNGVVV